MKFISLFAGIGGFDLGLERSGMECVAQVEIDPYCQKILAKHWPNVPRFEDVRNVGKHNLPTADLICGGFPCQDVSTAGKGAGIKHGTRSGLFFEFIRIICEVRPRWVVIENVRGLLSSNNGSDFSTVLWELSNMGFDAQWGVITASSFGTSHIRERIFLVAYPTCHDAQTHGSIFAQNISIPNAGASMQHSGLFATSWHGLKPNHGDMRTGNGVSNWVDRARGLGNAVVPQVAEFVGRCIMQAEMESRL